MTRIFVIKRKRLLLYGIVLMSIILLIILGISLSKRNRSSTDTQDTLTEVYSNENVYVPGVYTGQITVGSYNATLEVLVDGTQVKNVRMASSDEAVETMYPLVGSSVTSINNALRSGTELEELLSDNAQGYTYALLMNKISEILDKARILP